MKPIREEEQPNFDSADSLDGTPLVQGERLRLRWPDGSETEETVDLGEPLNEPPLDYGTYWTVPYKRWVWLLRGHACRGTSLVLRPAHSHTGILAERIPPAGR